MRFKFLEAKKKKKKNRGLGGEEEEVGGEVTMAADFSSVHLLHLFVLIISTFSGFFPRLVESHPAIVDLQWHPATATWYGSPDGDGSDGTFFALHILDYVWLYFYFYFELRVVRRYNVES